MDVDRLRSGLTSPWLLLGSVAVGGLVGATLPGLAVELAPVGQLYLALLEMCALPVLVTALTSAVARAVDAGHGSRYLQRAGWVFLLGMLAAGVAGALVGEAIAPGAGFSPEQRAALGAHVLEAGEPTGGPARLGEGGLIAFVRGMVPENVFHAAATGATLPLVTFCVLLGLGLGTLHSPQGATAIRFIDAGYETLLRIVTWVMYGLPLGLLCLVAERVASTGGDLVFAMVRFIGAVYLGAAVLLAVGALAIWARVGGAFLGTLRAVKAPVLVGLGTSSPIAAIPSMLQAVAAGLRRDPVGANLAVPLGVNLYVPGSTFYFALAALFVAQIYGVALGWQEYVVLVVASVFAAVAAPDTPGPSGVGALVVVLDPLGIPASVGVILLSVVDPLLEPAVAVADVHGNCMAAALVVDPVGPAGSEDLGEGRVCGASGPLPAGAPDALPGAVRIGGQGASHGA